MDIRLFQEQRKEKMNENNLNTLVIEAICAYL